MIEKWKQLRERKKKEPARATVPLHPLLFALWPVLFVYAENQQYVRISQTWSALLAIIGSTIMLFLILVAILRNSMKAGAVLSLLLVLFFSYGHVFSLLWPDLAAYVPTTESLVLMIVWALAFAAGCAVIFRVRDHWLETTKVLNVVALGLVMVSLFNIGLFEMGKRVSQRHDAELLEISSSGSLPEDLFPDIYYIILDAYARGDILEEMYDYDNSEFLSFLEGHGFYITERSRANYAQTDLSLASSLNSSYLDELVSIIGPERDDRRPLTDAIQDNGVIRFLRDRGYTIVGVPSGYHATDLRQVDVRLEMGRAWNEIEVRLLCSTPIPWLAIRENVFDPFAMHRQKVLFTLDHIVGSTDLAGPRFVFAHVLAPHGPFVFDANGNPIDPPEQFDLRDGVQFDEQGRASEEDKQGYVDQLVFVSNKIRAVIEDLITQSSRPTIVILQSDHGPSWPLDLEDPGISSLRQRLSILNAYLFPDRDYHNLHQEITPVNTFRVIFNQYLGTDLELLEDRSYYSTWERPYQFVDVTEEIRSSKD